MFIDRLRHLLTKTNILIAPIRKLLTHIAGPSHSGARVALFCVVISSVGVVVLMLIMTLWPRDIVFSYGGLNCIAQPHLSAGSLEAKSDAFTVEPYGVVEVKNTALGARGICLRPLMAPKPGTYRLDVSPKKASFIKTPVTVHVPDYPHVDQTVFEQPIPLGRKLEIPISDKDTVFVYAIALGDRSSKCIANDGTLACDLTGLGMKQGGKYEIHLDRYFHDAKVSTVWAGSISTLKAVTLKKSSIEQGQKVYAKPLGATFHFDKDIVSADVSLIETNGKKKTSLEAAVEVEGKKVLVSWKKDLARQKVYRIVFSNVVASDGSGLSRALNIKFSTSGGPKVVSVGIGSYGVPLGSTINLLFDQPLKKGQPITSAISVSGGGKVIGYDGKYATISLVGVPKCRDVTITVHDTLLSAYGIKGGSAWKYTTRTICQSVSSIGQSVQGRSILAYSFGSGSRTVVYTGAIHGDEVSTASLMYRWIDYLEANVRSIPSGKRVIVIPVVNPDGYALGRRTNVHNVDLNRNFDTSDWRKDITTTSNKPFPGGGGSSPLSEKESRALASYIAAVRPVLVLSYHSIGGLVVANQTGNSSSLASKYAAMSGYGNATGSSTTFDYSVSGTADDYYGQRLGIPSLLIELGSHTYPQFEYNRLPMWSLMRDS